jgi:hypothetical protein
VSVILKQLDAMDAQIELLRVMAAGIRHALTVPKAEEVALLPECASYGEEDCGRRNPAASTTFKTGQRMCRGCGLDPIRNE